MKLRDFSDLQLFADLNDEQLDTEAPATRRTLQQGEIFFREGDRERVFFVVVSGALQIFRIINGQEMPINPFIAGQFGGEVPLLAGTPHLASCRATTDTELLIFDEEAFWFLLSRFESVRKKVLAHMAERLTELQALSFQREKLASLGTMAAGLAHELNNPASAARRSAQNLVEALNLFGAHSSRMLKALVFKQVDPTEDPFEPLMSHIRLEGIELDPLTQSDREDELGEWLAGFGLPEPWNMAGALASVGYTRSILEDFGAALLPEQAPNFLLWLARDVEMRRLAHELVESTTRISDLVQAMKSYSYMDRDLAKEETFLHQGLNTTLTILNHKIQAKGIKVIKAYGDGIPSIEAYGSELNQVWTNLLDNAIDAAPEGGGITIKTYPDPADSNIVSVEITDNGPGIPPEVQSHIFDPFFTTKGVGQGTGLGLEITHRIVVNRHQGTINLTSQPGQTTFKVCLPVR